MSSSNRSVRRIPFAQRLVAAIIVVWMMAFQLSTSQAEVTGAQARRLVDSTIGLLRKPSKPTTQTTASQVFEDPAQRASHVQQLRLCPRRLILYVGETFTLVPRPLDRNGEVVQGAALNFETANASIATASSWGEVTAIAAGHTSITLSAGTARVTVSVEVRAGARSRATDRKQADAAFDLEHSHDCDDPVAAQSSAPQSEVASASTSIAPESPRSTSFAASDNRVEAFSQSFKRLSRPAVLHHDNSTIKASAKDAHATGQDFSPMTNFILDGDGRDPYSTAATKPYNAVGSPRFAAMQASEGSAAKTKNLLGSYDYVFSAPILAMGGRGIGVTLALTYNSRVWTKETGGMTFNYAKGWPAPGCTFGYGRLIDNYDSTGSGNLSGVGLANPPGNYLLIQPDGTRIHLQQSYDSASGTWLHNSNDGSFITLNLQNGKLRYPDGTLVTYSNQQNGRWLPQSIRTRNGDLITIAYKQYQKNSAQPHYFPVRWALSQITDTLGRVITFHYYGDPDDPSYPADSTGAKPQFALAAITAPDQAGGTRTVAQFDYQAITLQYNFSVPVDQNNNPASGSQIIVLRRIYYPATGLGYLFADYSTYGMARRISVRNKMTGANGAETDGTEITYTKYNYITIDLNDPYGSNQVGQLNDAPQYTTRSEWWQNKTDDTGAATSTSTDYSFSRSAGTDMTSYVTEVDTVTSQNGNLKVVTTSGNDQNNPLNYGRVTSVEYQNSSGATLRKVSYSYLQAPDLTDVQIDTVTTTDETGQSAKTSYDYYSTYGRVHNVYEYGFSSSVQRRTTFTYSDDSGLLGQNLIYVVTEADVYDGSNTLVAKTVNEIDNYSVNTILDYSVQPPNHDYQNFNATTGLTRGNVTKVTTSVLPGTGTIARSSRFDVFGNVVRADVSCCQVKNISYLDGSNNPTTYYSQPLSVTDGTPNVSPFLTTSYVYDFNTGLMTSTTDPNGQSISFTYDSAWRPATVNSPTGASSTTAFDKDSYGNDQVAYQQQITYKEKDTDSTSKTITSKSWFDGAGRVLRSGTGAGTSPTSFDTVATVYDSIGRVLKQSNPYTGDSSGNGSPAYWTKNVYDLLSRVTEVDLPDDNPSAQRSRVQTSYSGATVTVTDQVGRQRGSQVDGLGRLISVTEMNPATGSLDATNYLTTYSYDTLDNLAGVNQGGQTRSFSYDSLSRVTSQTTPEAGTVSYTYTDFGAVLKRTDFRNVETHYKYDTLNRLIQVWYTGLGGDDAGSVRPALPSGVAATPDVTIAYRTSTPGNGAVDTITDGAGSESYVYDSFSRTTSKTRTVDGNAYQTQYQYNQINQLGLMIYPSGKRVRTNFDSRGRMSGEDKVDTAGNLLTSYTSSIGYNVAGQVTGMTDGSGVVESYTYSADRLQLTRQTAVKSGSTLMDLNYGYAAAAGASGTGTTAGNSGQLMAIGNNPSSQPSSINGQTRTQTFTYDDLGRLTTATGWSAWQRRFDYDRWGNRTGVWDATTGGNQIQSVRLQMSGGVPTNQITTVTNNGAPSTQTYDASGNLTSDGAHNYQYDGEGRIASVDAGGANYFYDSASRRVKKQQGTTITYYVWEGGQVIAEYSNATAGSGTSYYLADRLSNRMITDTSGAFKGTQDHLPFGDDANTGSGQSEKHRFTNYERDNESSTDYAMNRQYEMNNGRYKQPDIVGGSMGDPQSLNRYAYSLNDPVNVSDPLGLDPIVMFPRVPSQFDASNPGPGIYWDGIRVEPTWYRFLFGAVENGAAVIAPFGATAHLGYGGTTYIDLPYDATQIGNMIVLGVTSVAVSDWSELFQNSGPTIAFGPNYQNLIQPFRDAFDDAVKRLNSKKDCAKLFGGLQKALDTLNSATYRLFDKPPELKYQDGKWVPSVTGAATYPGNMVMINLSGPFFNGPDLKMSGNRSFKADFATGLKGSDLAALLLLHELGHQVGKWGSDAGIGDKAKNLEHTMAVYKACF